MVKKSINENEIIPENKKIIDNLNNLVKQIKYDIDHGHSKSDKLKNMFRLQKGDIIIVKKNKLIDKAFDSLNGNYIYLDQDFINEIPKCDTLASPDGKPRVVLIDDCDGLQSSKLKKAYIEFLNDVVTAGRKYNLYVIVCAHALANKTVDTDPFEFNADF